MRLCVLLLLVGGCGPSPFGATAVERGVLPQASSIAGRDGGPSGLVWGHSVWTFGDTVLTLKDVDGTNWHHNSYSITDDLVASDGIGGFVERLDAAGAPRYFLAPTADEESFNAAHRGNPCATTPCGARWAVWSGPPIWDDANQRAIIFYGLIYAEPGNFNFHGVGQSVAVWSDFTVEPQRPLLTPGADHPTLLFGPTDPPWGTAALVDGGLLYVFGCDSGRDGLSPPCSLAEVDPARVLDRSAWRYWNGHAFTSDGKATLFAGAPTLSVGWNAHLGAWLALYTEPLSNRVVGRTARALTGPWSAARLLFTANRKPEGAYDANWHHEYDELGGKILYVSFSRPNGHGLFGSEFALERVTLP
jgi:uncharacterized protein DUF4185